MYYSETIWRLYYNERKTIKEIVEYFHDPLVSEPFVTQVIENILWLRRPPKYWGNANADFHKRLRGEREKRVRQGRHRRAPSRKKLEKLW